MLTGSSRGSLPRLQETAPLRHSPVWIAQAMLRTLVLGGLALALAQPAVRRAAGGVGEVALVDVSDSVSAAVRCRQHTTRRTNPHDS